MTAENFAIAIGSFSRRRPFRPYLIELISGTRLRISHPEAVRVRNGIAQFIASGDDARNYVFDHDSVSVVCDDES